MDQAASQAISEHRCPGGVVWLEHRGQHYAKAYGQRAVVPAAEPMTEDTLFDAASLTKVIATTPAVMLLVERGLVKLDAPVATYIPEFTGAGREKVTVRQLLTHTSGLRPDIGLKPDWSGYAAAIKLCCAEKLTAEPDEKVIYSDTNFILLGEIVRRVSRQTLDAFLQREVYGPLGMADTGFNPPRAKLPRIAPTEVESGQPVRGVVHDPRARRMAGVAGHAGLFTTAADLARFARMMLNQGTSEGHRVFRPETVALMTQVQTPTIVPSRRGLGWDIDSGYSGPRGKLFTIGSYGHTGWTGTSIWLDPFSQSFVIFLSNRNHPTEDGSVIALRARLGTLAAEAIADFNFGYVPGALGARGDSSTRTSDESVAYARVLTGIDVLKQRQFAPLRGLRLGLITNHTGQDRERVPTIDLLKNAPGVQLVALFSPEHGIRGLVDEKVTDSVDEKTGLPVFSLYGETRKPTPEQLQNLDALVFDIQDVGCRFYTYISTMGLAMEAAAENGKKIFVLDRPNPIDGITVDGPLRHGDGSFTAWHPIPVRHGLTVGELAQLFKTERRLAVDLTVIPMQNWSREMLFDQTALPWTNPSPNMRSLTEAILYPGVGLLEFCEVSVGRGTDTPFEVVGAPYVDELRLADELNRAGITGVRFVPVRFTPIASVFKGKSCSGVNIILTDRRRARVVDIGLRIAQTLNRLYPQQFSLEKFNKLLVDRTTLGAVREGKSLNLIRQEWRSDLEEFQKRRASCLIYQ